MQYDRLTRALKIKIKGEEYSLRLDIGALAEIEDVMPNGKLVEMFINRQLPSIKVLEKAICVGMSKDGKKVDGKTAKELFQDYVFEVGIPEVTNVYYILLAVSGMLGDANAQEILSKAGLVNKDDTSIVGDQKNAV